MKKISVLMLILLIAVSCLITSEKTDFKRSDLFGTWKPTKDRLPGNPAKDLIVEFVLNADSTAIYKLKTVDGIKDVNGTWKDSSDINVLGKAVSLHSDLTLRYSKSA